MGDLSQATREIMWNISGADVMYLLFIVSLAIFAYGLYRRIKRWKRGRPDSERFANLPSRFLFMAKEVVLQKKNWNVIFPGVFHALFFYSFIALMVTTLVILLDYDLGTHLFNGALYAALTLASDIAGGLILTGVALALWRRYGQRPKTLQTEWSDAGILLLLALMVVTGFLIEGLRIQHAGDRWAALSPIGFLLSGLFDGMPEQSGKAWHAVLWWMTWSVNIQIVVTGSS
jgi:nitrate reductase gamma subunit